MVPAVSASADASSFIGYCEQWLCDGYYLDIRYIATEAVDGPRLFDALLLFSPLPPTSDSSLAVTVPPLAAGQEQTASATKEQLLGVIKGAIEGAITVSGRILTLPSEGAYRFQRTVMDQNTWFMRLTLQVHGSEASRLLDRTSLDTALRVGTPPFDGAEDLRAWLGLRLPEGGSLSGITIAVNPPVDMLLERSHLRDGICHLVFHAHPKADLSQVRVAIREVPGQGLLARTQVGEQITWGGVDDYHVEGRADLALPTATGALVMLIVGGQTVRRHWFIDQSKAPNLRYAGVQHFDPDLRMIRRGLFDDSDSSRFEIAVAALLFLLGFSSAIQLEKDSPDLIVVTPRGRLIIVECTTRLGDVAAKIGKLVDRREALQRKLRADGAGAEVSAALVCRVPRDQIAAHADNLKAMRILLVPAEDLTEGLTRAWATNEPDDILDQVLRASPS